MSVLLKSNERPGVILVGYRGTGKSTVGRLLADRLSLPFHDADLVLESRQGLSVRSIFADHGEPAFRDWEEEVLGHLTSGPAAVISTGGGAVLRETNRRAIGRFGFVVWLTAGPAILGNRLRRDASAADARPALTAAGTLDEIAEVLAARTPHYRAVADAEVDTGSRTPREVVETILTLLPTRERGL